MRKFKKGAASFYIISLATLILVIIASSFATVILSEVARSSNDDLSQSAYDSALAGVEDAKLAFANYRRCKEKGITISDDYEPSFDNTTITCSDIIYYMENPDCDMVAHMIGRLSKSESGEVMISDTITRGSTSVTSNLNQAYTCAEIKTVLRDYRANLTSSNNVRLVKAEFANNVTASDIVAVELSWYSTRDGESFNYSNFDNGEVKFRPITEIRPSTPPTIRIQLMQTANTFTLDQAYGIAQGDATDRATMFFVPTKEENKAQDNKDGNYKGIYNASSETNELSVKDVVKTNDQSVVNVPYVTFCDDRTTGDFMCSVKINLPKPISTDGSRNDDTFMFLVMIPYGEPDTDFAMKFLCKDNNTKCVEEVSSDDETKFKMVAEISGVQILIDSTGRANDLYRRVETRLESADVTFPYIYYALQLLGDGDEPLLSKQFTVKSEYNRTTYSE